MSVFASELSSSETIIQFYLSVRNTHSLDAAAIDFSSLQFSENNPEKAVNDWVEKETDGKIDKIIGKLGKLEFSA